MKTLLALAITLLSLTAFAGPTISGGVPVHPALLQMEIVAPEAGVDYPTDSSTDIKAVLALYNNNRIKIYNETPKLVAARAGQDYPTDSTPPAWSRYQKVLVFKNRQRVAVRVGLDGDSLLWNTSAGEQINVADINSIKLEEAGVDYPTDFPHTPQYILELNNGSHVSF